MAVVESGSVAPPRQVAASGRTTSSFAPSWGRFGAPIAFFVSRHPIALGLRPQVGDVRELQISNTGLSIRFRMAR